ncbi:endolytic transglycosylase MltG [bacterium]|nr:endolytic transglycosylase MltG [bacterium]
MRKKIEKIAIVLAAGILLAVTHFYVTFLTPPSSERAVKTVRIERGMSFRVIAETLEREGIVRDADTLGFAARILGAYKKVKAGEYEFTTDMTPFEVLDSLVKGRIKRYSVTLPEGYNIKEMAAALDAAGLVKAEVFIARALDPELAASLGVEGPTLEGYLFPDTYEFTKGLSADEMISRMVSKFKKVYSEFEDEAREEGLSMRKVVTLASIIEKETGAPSEREIIAGVFHNRLRQGIKLQSDPTVIYSIPGFDGKIRKSHLSTKSPYNTYVNYGLPPGPIASPGRESIAAALRPAKTDYIYFVSKNDGTHQFSRTLVEHNRAVDEFQRRVRVSSIAGEKEKALAQDEAKGRPQ